MFTKDYMLLVGLKYYIKLSTKLLSKGVSIISNARVIRVIQCIRVKADVEKRLGGAS